MSDTATRRLVSQSPVDGTVLLHGLRRRGDETQFTQVIAALANAERDFAPAFVRVLLSEASVNRAETVARLEPVPDALECRAELSIGDYGDAFGRVDLCFDGGTDFRLFVENKLYCGYGEEQIPRYLDALRILSPERTRTGLIAVTRDIPGYGEPGPTTERWLGSIRWATLLPQLLDLPLSEPLGSQWRDLLMIMHQEGDLGTTKPDTDAIEAWARHRIGREELGKLLMQIRDRSLGVLHDAMTERFPRRKGDELVAHHTFGKRGKVAVKHELTRTRIGFRVPASEQRDPGLTVQFSNYHGTPHFTVQAEPLAAEELLRDKDERFVKASKALLAAGFAHDRGYWAHAHGAEEWLRSLDVPEELARLADADIKAIVASGILDLDIEESGPKQRGIRRWRRKADEAEDE